ncbi:DUF6121 family protein [Okibacterium fritillariae]|uniref:Uncharacterized protein n=1 Tax=Okibacterium fritillariae TaxID=123320 RepID=A0A1T5K698_9MICO|nr:DUF6121 family protein [Okibacterium fritillariae]SKC59153.1 hypothetical protein SAMN06309945_1938 [Okibacterium fritillariae]
MSTPSGEPNRYPVVLAIFAGITFFALVVCAFGFISLFTNLEVIDEPDAGPLVGPSMVAFALAAFLISLLRRAATLRAPQTPAAHQPRTPDAQHSSPPTPDARSFDARSFDAPPSSPPDPSTAYPRRPASDASRVPVGWAVLTGLATYLVYALSGAVLYAATTGSILAGVIFARDTFLGPFALAAGIAALVVALVFAILVIVGGEHPRRPLWPWERDRG